ncbi:MAG TPA: vWA domain-containing protein, partial [Candidatus Eisenbacteria bacterium]|nr:vWA domain-containing protein [Candidatus Eisenbacteria bacterium]
MSWFERWRGLEWAPPFGAGWLLVLLVLLAVGYAVFLYRRNDAPLDARTRSLLTALRAAAFVLLLCILSRPVLSLSLPGGAAKGVLVLVDRSESMMLPGGEGYATRDAEATKAVEQIRETLSGKYPWALRPFGAGVAPAVDPQTPLPPANGEATDLNRALEAALASEGPVGKPGAVILVSDGTATSGSDPVNTARRLGIPVETVKLGSAHPVPDLTVSRVRA